MRSLLSLSPFVFSTELASGHKAVEAINEANSRGIQITDFVQGQEADETIKQ